VYGRPEQTVIGWDVGGAHLKACWLQDGQVQDVAQWPCPLWQGLPQLDAALAQAGKRWPGLERAAHAVTMTGEMVDLFTDRADGVQRIAAQLARVFIGPLRFYAGDQGWCRADEAAAAWAAIASANWLATARHVAGWAEGQRSTGVLIDIGSTTTDLIGFGAGRVLARGRSDSERLASGELVYQGVVRTPLCALAPRVCVAGTEYNVMNEFFATTADVYRLSGELAAEHDQQPSADGAAKDLAATRQRLARMVGLDAADVSNDGWLQAAQAWRAAQIAEISGQLRRVLAARAPSATPVVVSAGCGSFLVPGVLAAAGLPADTAVHVYGGEVAPIAALAQADAVRRWAQVCAPSVAVALLYQRGLH
jgi:(4-(4-[2-(gamma-L-glutamylamino)ethyl]phenoxymethyl)furan-2-yl)methanamine synthase